jgi:large subunit ribosomal protein L5
MARLKKYYQSELKIRLKENLGFKNILEVPKITKIVVNIGVGEAAADSKKIDSAVSDLTAITGQKPMITQAKKSIAGFKLRKGVKIGCKVTLRKNRDFKGLSKKSFDGMGNYSIGIKEQIIFPEIDYDKIDKVRGMDISIVTSTNNQTHAFELLKGFNLPFKN